MAIAERYACDKCGYAVDAWSDGNPYYIDESGQKKYAYHPDHVALSKCIGNDVPYLCLACGLGFNIDSRSAAMECPRCQSKDIAEFVNVGGHRCPRCKSGMFSSDPKLILIS